MSVRRVLWCAFLRQRAGQGAGRSLVNIGDLVHFEPMRWLLPEADRVIWLGYRFRRPDVQPDAQQTSNNLAILSSPCEHL